MEKTREFLRSIGLPGGDAYDLPTSSKRFPDGAQYRFEVPGIQGPKVMAALLAEMDRYGISLHRVTQTKGIMMLTDNEIIEMVRLAGEAQTDLILAIGPRATTDTSASVHTEEGVRMGYRLRGQEQIVRAIEDVKRATAFGCHSFLVYDEGCLWVLNEIPIDIHTENPKSTGGFIRHYEVPEMIRVAAPIYLKTGGSVAATHSWDSTEQDAKKRAKQVSLVKRMIDCYYPEAIVSPKGSIR